MSTESDLILTASQIDQRIVRMAYEIYENNIEQKNIILAGVSDNGFALANMIATELEKISPIELKKVKIDINKEEPLQDKIEVGLADKDIAGKAIVIIDDVLNSGRTMAFVLKAFLNVNVKKIEIGVMVNRSHKSFPIYPQYTGYELATTINDHISVVLEGKKKGVYLF